MLSVLNDTVAATHERNLRQILGFDFTDPVTQQIITLNQSSFSRANVSRPAQLWQNCFTQLLPLVRSQVSPRHLAGLGTILAVDGSLFDCLPRMIWAVYRKSSPKVRGHFFLDLAGLPQKLVLTVSTGSESEALRQNLQSDVTYLYDRGYNDYSLFQHIMHLGAHFVTRPLSNAVFSVVQQLEVEGKYQKH